jgi:hypothetical protein
MQRDQETPNGYDSDQGRTQRAQTKPGATGRKAAQTGGTGHVSADREKSSKQDKT